MRQHATNPVRRGAVYQVISGGVRLQGGVALLRSVVAEMAGKSDSACIIELADPEPLTSSITSQPAQMKKMMLGNF